MTTRWARSHPDAVTDRLHPVQAVPARRPITWRLPRVRKVILRDPVDQLAASTLDAYLHQVARPTAARDLSNAIIGTRHLSHAALARVDKAVAAGLTLALARLRPAATRADQLLAAATSRCPTCTPTETCTEHQHVLNKWWDLRDQAAVRLVNDVVAAMTLPANTPRPHRTQPRTRS